MEGLEACIGEEMADLFVDGQPLRITAVHPYFRLKHVAAWGPTRIRVNDFDTWEELGRRLERRLGVYLWHPSHFDAYWARQPATLPERDDPDKPATRPTRAQRKAALVKMTQASLFG